MGAALRLLAQEYYSTEVADIEILDVFAEKIWYEKDTKNSSMADAMAYFCLTLAKSKNPRYRSFLETIAHEAKPYKIKRHAESSFKLLPIENVEQFKVNIK